MIYARDEKSRQVEARAALCFKPNERSSVANPYDYPVPKPAYPRGDLLRSGQGGSFGPGNAQLLLPSMLMMDRIIEISLDGGEFGKGHVVSELDFTPDLWFFTCHFKNDPVMPGCLGLDAM